jgi:hypothetical protein
MTLFKKPTPKPEEKPAPKPEKVNHAHEDAPQKPAHVERRHLEVSPAIVVCPTCGWPAKGTCEVDGTVVSG